MAEGVLGEIVAAKQAELAQRYRGVSLDALRQQTSPTKLSLAQAIARPGARFILEVKRASPSRGTIRPDADPAVLARGYAGVADALSVLTDTAYFGGSLRDLSAARTVFDGPILAKDFFTDRRQVAEARLAGADALLVMLSVLDDQGARAMIEEARRFGMDALVEVHDESEMRRALALGAPLIGINNRDLRDLRIDLRTTERLAALAPDRLLVAESGIRARDDVDRLAGRVDAFLVGSALMSAADPADAARALVFGRVKLCGLRTPDDLKAGRAAAFVGLMFVPESPRALTLHDSERLVEEPTRAVGVFRNAPLAQVAETASHLALRAVQLHGDEDASYVADLRRALPDGCEVWGAVDASRLRGRDGVDRLLFDQGTGGTGRSFDWATIADHPDLPLALLAGGIGPANARAAMALGPYAIDVGSQVDAAPGVKSAAKIAELFDALRPTSRAELRQCA